MRTRLSTGAPLLVTKILGTREEMVAHTWSTVSSMAKRTVRAFEVPLYLHILDIFP